MLTFARSCFFSRIMPWLPTLAVKRRCTWHLALGKRRAAGRVPQAQTFDLCGLRWRVPIYLNIYNYNYTYKSLCVNFKK